MDLLWEKHNWTLLHMFRKMLICHVSLAGACVSLTLNIFDLHQICHTACPWNISQMRNNEIMPPEKIYDHWSLCFTNLWSVDYRGKFAKWWRCKFLTNLFDICKQQIRNSDLWQRIWIQNNKNFKNKMSTQNSSQMTPKSVAVFIYFEKVPLSICMLLFWLFCTLPLKAWEAFARSTFFIFNWG